MKKQLTKSLLLGSLVLSSLVFGTFNINAADYKLPISHDAKLMSSEKFYSILETTKPNEVASNFGMPDNIISMRNAAGVVTGVVWVYHNAVLKEQAKLDANFALVNGEFKYVTLSNAS
ncbi:MAG: hypothetical protein ACT4OH_05190 [Methylophilaceae bacterium]